MSCWQRLWLILPLTVSGPHLDSNGAAWAQPESPQQARADVQELAGNEQVAEIMRTFAPRGVQADQSQPTPPQEYRGTFTLRPGLDIDLVTSEPHISQPLFLSWDSRGRMWVVQYRQYQYPAGLKVVRFDHHLRAVFDRVPEPPPNHVPGLDRLTVFEDSDGDGSYDRHHDVLTGLNIATSVAIGRGGIWVLNPPYLLFYPDRNRDDVPDADPEVHLAGFGLQDTHSVANSLMWGPDGWLYGANGSTTTGTVSSAVTAGVSFEGQCIWRYHPVSREFEIYAEGGGNTFSLEIDARGRVFSGTNGGNTRGWYYPQGSYSAKNWGKHGPLTNPYAFGFFSPMRFEGDGRRFPQAFLIYEGGLLPEEFQGDILAPNAMQNLVWHSERISDGSTYRTTDHAELLQCSDRWFRPVYAGVGPEGAVYIADWYDTRLSHVSPLDDWHKTSGRIYRIRPQVQDDDPLPAYRHGDLHLASAEQLINHFTSKNKWLRQRSCLELGWRSSLPPETIAQLIEAVNRDGSLESLWALNMQDQLSDALAAGWLSHADPDIRRWTARLLGDAHRAHPKLITAATQEEHLQVRSQLAATAKRVEAAVGLAIAARLVALAANEDDLHLPLMIWWAIEAHCENWPAIEEFLQSASLWQQPLMRNFIAGRLMQRYATEGTAEGLRRCEQLIELAPEAADRQALVAGLNRAFQGRVLPPLPPPLKKALADFAAARGDQGLVLSVQQGRVKQFEPALALLRDADTELALRIELAQAFGQTKFPPAASVLLQLGSGRMHAEPVLQRVALRSLALYENDDFAITVAKAFDNRIPAEHSLRSTACRTLASRKSWALVLLNEVNQWRLKPTDIPADVVQRLRSYDDDVVRTAVEQAFGKPASINSAEKVHEIERLNELLTASVGDPAAGKTLFAKHCGSCHRLFGEGQSIGPALDNYDRGNLKFWLPALVAPSIEIREGYQSYLTLTKDERVITGMIEAQSPAAITLRTADNQQVILDRNELVEFRALPTSLMPDNLVQQLSDQQLIDLFAYLRLTRNEADAH